MVTYILKTTGAAFSEAAYQSRVTNGANPNDFEAVGEPHVEAVTPTPEAAATAVAASTPDVIHVPTGSRFSDGAREDWIRSGRAQASDFVAVGDAVPGAASTAAPVAAPATTPVPGNAIVGYHTTGGLHLTPAAAGNYLARGLCAAADLIPIYETPVVAAPVAGTVLPIDPDSYTRAQLGAVAHALGLDSSGSKAALVATINAHGDESGTALAVANL